MSKTTKKASRTPRAMKAAKPTPATPEKKFGVKTKVAALLMTGGAFTLDELLRETGAKKVTLQTALSDLRSEKYCGPTGRLNIVQVDGKYTVRAESKQ